MATCGDFTASFGFNCATPLQSGTKDRAWVLSHADYEAATKTVNATNRFIIEDITLAGSDVAWYIDGKKNSNAPSFTLVPQTYGDVYDHTFNFLVFDMSNAGKKALAGIVGGRYVVIFENSFKGVSGQSAFEILGAGNGLEVTAFNRDPLSNDNQGAYVLTMATGETGKEPDLPLSFFDTDYATTRAALEALLV